MESLLDETPSVTVLTTNSSYTNSIYYTVADRNWERGMISPLSSISSLPCPLFPASKWPPEIQIGVLGEHCKLHMCSPVAKRCFMHFESKIVFGYNNWQEFSRTKTAASRRGMHPAPDPPLA